jgi:hypothetical protein
MEVADKRAALGSFSLTVAAIVLIAAGLPGLRFEQGIPLPEADAGGTTLVLPNNEGGIALPIGKFMVTVLIVVLSAIILVAAVRKIMGLDWKGFWLLLGKSLIAVLGFTLLLLIVFNLFPRGSLYPPNAFVEPQPPVSIYEGTVPEAPPGVLVWLVGAAAAVLLTVMCLRLLTGKDEVRRELDLVGLEAQSARLALLSGRNFKDVILDCYRRMSTALKKEHGIERQESMTAREFEALLEERGVPGESVHRLTLLFESARYGTGSPSPDEEDEAIRCLEEIERYAKEGKRA